MWSVGLHSISYDGVFSVWVWMTLDYNYNSRHYFKRSENRLSDESRDVEYVLTGYVYMWIRGQNERHSRCLVSAPAGPGSLKGSEMSPVFLTQGAANDGGPVLLRCWLPHPQEDVPLPSEGRAGLQRLLHQAPGHHTGYVRIQINTQNIEVETI